MATHTTPVKGKRAFLPGWPGRPLEALEFEKYATHNLGILCGGNHNIVAIDVDVTDEPSAVAIEEQLIDQLGEAPKRVGKAPKFLYVYRENKARKKKTVTVAGGEIEVLAEGQQFVASGIHPETRQKYDWPGDNLTDYRADELPLINDEDLERFLVSVETSAPSKNENLNGTKLHLDLPSRNMERLRQIKAEEKWNDPMCELTGALVKKGLLREEIIELCLPHRWNGYSEAETRAHLEKMVDGALKKGFAPEIKIRDRRPIQTISEVFYSEPIEWLCEGLIPKRGVGLISGASGSFKSFLWVPRPLYFKRRQVF